ISPLLTAAISVALGAAAVTGGDLDPTVGSAMRELGYDRTLDDVPQPGPPSPCAFAGGRPGSGYVSTPRTAGSCCHQGPVWTLARRPRRGRPIARLRSSQPP